MPRKIIKKSKKVNDNFYFDVENVKLILLCFLFGVFGVHKFIQGKKGQGICFILLDLTIIGMFVSLIWAFCDLIALTFKQDNKVGNMVIGTFCLCGGLFGWPAYFDEAKTVFIKETVTTNNKQELVVKKGELICNQGIEINFDILDGKVLVLHVLNDHLTLNDKSYSKGYDVYQGTYMKVGEEFMKLDYSSNPQDTITVKLPKKSNLPAVVSGKLSGFYNEYTCSVEYLD